MAPIGLKLWQNAFQTIPHISFFGDKPPWKKKNCVGFSRPRTTSKNLHVFAVLEELRFFERNGQMRLEKLLRFPRFSARYDPWRRGKRIETCFWPPSSEKNDFHMTCVLMKNEKIQKIIIVSPLWRSKDFLSEIGRCVLKSYYDFPDFQLVATLGGGVKE